MTTRAPDPAECVAVVPFTLKEFAGTPVRVKPVFAVMVKLRVYTVPATKLPVGAKTKLGEAGVMAYCGVELTVTVFCALPCSKFVNVMLKSSITASEPTAPAVVGYSTFTTLELASFFGDAPVPATPNESAVTPWNVQPVLGVRVMIAVYFVLVLNFPSASVMGGSHSTVPVYCRLSVVVTAALELPATGASKP